LRVCAEDPANNFLPDIGRLLTYRTPQGYGVRVDDSFEEGMEIPIHYDPMIAKLITFGKNRDEAIARMIRAIDDYHISGIETTLVFGKFAMQHEAFVSGKFDTKFIDKYFKPELLPAIDVAPEVVALAAGTLFSNQKAVTVEQQPSSAVMSGWKRNRKDY
jgi:acetyl-CoA carboxylase, biotin carboxylase subunit